MTIVVTPYTKVKPIDYVPGIGLLTYTERNPLQRHRGFIDKAMDCAFIGYHFIILGLLPYGGPAMA